MSLCSYVLLFTALAAAKTRYGVSPLQRAWQVLLELFAQELAVDVGVELGGAYAFVAEHGLYGSEVSTALEEVGGEGVAQVMKADAGQPRPLQHSLEHVQDAVWGHGASGGRWEYPFAISDLALLHF